MEITDDTLKERIAYLEDERNFTHPLDRDDEIYSICKELRRWRAAFAWLFAQRNGVVGPNSFGGWIASCDYSDVGSDAWFYFDADGDAATDCIEALRAKVGAKP